MEGYVRKHTICGLLMTHGNPIHTYPLHDAAIDADLHFPFLYSVCKICLCRLLISTSS